MGDFGLGLVFHWLGGAAAAAFYAPYRKTTQWSWQTFWLVGGVISWLVAPVGFALVLVPGFWNVITNAPASSLGLTYVFGVLWGIGGLTFGLTMRYLGIALGMAVALGFCSAFGTLIPPFVTDGVGGLLGTPSAQTVFIGVVVAMMGIALNGAAGVSKEKELSESEKTAAVAEFNLVKGLTIAGISGALSACMAFGLQAGAPISELTKILLIERGQPDTWQSLPTLVVVLSGGLTTNALWCLWLGAKEKTLDEFLAPQVPLFRNYALCAIGGILWYLQFFFYSVGETQMGAYGFSSWTLHMASIIIFSTIIGVALKEWSGTSRRTRVLVLMGLVLLIASTAVIGFGNRPEASEPSTASTVVWSTPSEG